jgi:hypothetical protein
MRNNQKLWIGKISDEADEIAEFEQSKADEFLRFEQSRKGNDTPGLSENFIGYDNIGRYLFCNMC